MTEAELKYQREWNDRGHLVITSSREMEAMNLRERLAKVCRERNRSRSFIMTEAVNEYLNRLENGENNE